MKNKKIMEELRSSTSLMMTYAGLGMVSMAAGVFWNIFKV